MTNQSTLDKLIEDASASPDKENLLKKLDSAKNAINKIKQISASATADRQSRAEYEKEIRRTFGAGVTIAEENKKLTFSRIYNELIKIANES